MKYANALGLSALLTLTTAHMTLAHAESLTEHLVQCDSTFFNDIQQDTVPLSDKARQNATAIIDSWAENNPSTRHANYIKLSQPLRDGSLLLKSLSFSSNLLSKDELYYYWGLVTPSTPDEIIKATPHIAWIKAGNSYMHHPKIKRTGENEWKDNNAAVDGVAVSRGKVEKLTLLERKGNFTIITCTLQGSVSLADTRAIFSYEH